jgi:threonine dehydratase
VKSEKISLVTIEAIREAAARIAGVAVKTPLVRAPFPGLAGYGFQKEIRLKAESLQPIGAFKMRGARQLAAWRLPKSGRRSSSCSRR